MQRVTRRFIHAPPNHFRARRAWEIMRFAPRFLTLIKTNPVQRRHGMRQCPRVSYCVRLSVTESQAKV